MVHVKAARIRLKSAQDKHLRISRMCVFFLAETGGGKGGQMGIDRSGLFSIVRLTEPICWFPEYA